MDPNHVPVADSAPYHDALEQCVAHWGLVPAKTVLVRDGVNHVFATETAAGAPVIVRVTDGDIRDHAELEAELLWLDHLIRNGCTVTTPIESRAGALLETIELTTGTFHVCCFERFGGRELAPKTDPAWNDDLLRALGSEIGRIHRASDDLELPPGKDRHAWYESELARFPDPLPDAFDPEIASRMQEFTEEMRTRPTRERHYGLVHRDLHSGNFLVEDGRVQIIDFDLGCYGWRAMDFAVLLYIHYALPSHSVPGASPALMGKALACLVEGYRSEYVMDDEQLEGIAELMRLREILIYIATMPDLEHWQVATGNPEPSMEFCMRWIENRWRRGRVPEIDLSWVT